LFVRAVREGTVNAPGSHPRLLAVGCTINRHRWNALDVGTIELTGLGSDDEIPL
jgi:hypothetical protein